jgi:hypothetical protein
VFVWVEGQSIFRGIELKVAGGLNDVQLQGSWRMTLRFKCCQFQGYEGA